MKIEQPPPASLAETERPVQHPSLMPEEPQRVAGRLAVIGGWIADSRGWKRLAIALGVYVGSLAAFSIVVAVKGASPFGIFGTMIRSSILEPGSLAQVLLRAVPVALAALAVAVPARAGLVNVGGEGQLIVGAVASAGLGVAVGAHVPGPISWLIMAVAGAGAGAAWAGISAILRTRLNANEAVTTLLLNFVANDIMLYLIYQPWKDPNGNGQPQSRPLASAAHLPLLGHSQVDLGVVLALAIAAGVFWLLKYTGWGFALRIAGGNRVAARRFGLPVERLMLTSMLVGGALAGLGGMLNLAGLEYQLRPGITAGFGYVAFLASWLGRHNPGKVVLAAVLFSAINLSANGLQLTYGLDGAVVNILLALIVVAPLVLSKSRKAAA